MKCAARFVVVLPLLLIGLAGAPAAQNAPVQAPPALTPSQMETFLLKAKILRNRDAEGGITGSRRATLSDGTLTHDAHVQTIDQALSQVRTQSGPPERDFKDTYRYNIAGYRVAALLGLDHVPMSVERNVEGRRASVTWWVDDVLMDERERLKSQEPDSARERVAMQTYIMRVFDELIANRDRNLGNLVWTKDWKMWMIDHTRAFRLSTELQRPNALVRVDRSLLDSMRTLTQEGVSKAAGNSLTRYEVQAMLTRRDAIVKLFDEKIKERGEAPVLFAMPR
jgi:hypothetical protein